MVAIWITIIFFSTVVGVVSVLLYERHDLKNALNRQEEDLLQSQKLLIEKQSKLEEYIKKIAVLEVEVDHLKDALSRERANEERMQKEMGQITQKVLQHTSSSLQLENKSHLADLLVPLKERITHFESALQSAHREVFDKSVALKTQIKHLTMLHHDMAKKADGLAEAISGRPHKQGYWGEFVLEKILEQSGLQEGQHYRKQMVLSSVEGKKSRPDIILILPKDRHIIVDAKVSLTAYEKFFHAKAEQERARYLKEHIKSVKQHIKDLSSRNYARIHTLKSIEFVLLFMPVESAFSTLVANMPNILDEAQHAGVVLVSPSTLITTLKTIAFMWSSNHQNEYASKVLAYSGKLYDKFVGFVETHKKIGNALEQAQKAYQESGKKLVSGKGNLLSQAERLKVLGAKTNKKLPSIDKVDSF